MTLYTFANDSTSFDARSNDLDLGSLGVDPNREYQVHDLLGEGSYTWRGSRNYVELTPESLPAHILLVRRQVRTERSFDQF